MPIMLFKSGLSCGSGGNRIEDPIRDYFSHRNLPMMITGMQLARYHQWWCILFSKHVRKKENQSWWPNFVIQA